MLKNGLLGSGGVGSVAVAVAGGCGGEVRVAQCKEGKAGVGGLSPCTPNCSSGAAEASVRAEKTGKPVSHVV